MFGLKQTLKALVCGALLLASVSAQETFAPLSEVAITADFPNAIQGLAPTIVSGENNNIKVSFRNTGKKDLKVNMIVGSLVALDNFDQITRNLTAYRYGTVLKAEDTLILPYNLKLEHPSVETGLILMADIIDADKKHYPTMIYNSTVLFSEPVQSWFDVQLIFLYILLAGIFAAIGMFVKDAFTPEVKAVKKKAAALTPEEREAALEKMKVLDEDWIGEQHRAIGKRQTKKSSKKAE